MSMFLIMDMACHKVLSSVQMINQRVGEISVAHIAKPKNWYSKYTWKSFYNEYKEGKQPDIKNRQRRWISSSQEEIGQ